MKKPYRYNELSEQRCINPNCNKLLKKNLVEKKNRRNLLCYKCHTTQEKNRRFNVQFCTV